jgi:hypothetical protein
MRPTRRFEDTMPAKRIIAIIVTTTALTIPAAAGESYAFPSPSGVQLAAAPAPTFVPPSTPIAGSFVYGAPSAHPQHEPPLVPPVGIGSPIRGHDAYAFRVMSNALVTASYANYTADYVRLFAPGDAVNTWTGRVYGLVEMGYGAIDGWTAATYGMASLRSGLRKETAPDLSPMPQLRPHPELERQPTFQQQD